MSEKTENTETVRTSQVAAGALAAVTAALIGSTMGVAGTVVGAGLASVISTVGGTLYLKSIQRTRESVRTVRAKVIGRSGGATVLVSDEDPERPSAPGEEVDAAPAAEETADRPPAARASGRRRWAVVAVTSLAAFAVGMLAITGVEWVRGESLSGGAGTTFGSIVAQHHDSGGTDPSAPTTSTTTPTPTTSTSDPTNATSPTTSTTPQSQSDSTTTTTPPPVTTTTVAVPEGSAPASE
jgi:hypothetical protein